MMQDETRVEVVQGEEALLAAYKVGYNDGADGDWNPDTFIARHRTAFAAPPAAEREEDEAVIDVAVRLLLAEVNPAHAEQVRRGIRSIEDSTIDGSAVMRAICNALAFAPTCAENAPVAHQADHEAIAREVEAAIPMPGNYRQMHGTFADGMFEAARIIRTPSTGRDGSGGETPADVRRLVIAARLMQEDGDRLEAFVELDRAAEAFADRVPWDDEPGA